MITSHENHNTRSTRVTDIVYKNGRRPQMYSTSSSETMKQVKLNLGYSSMYILLQSKIKRGRALQYIATESLFLLSQYLFITVIIVYIENIDSNDSNK